MSFVKILNDREGLGQYFTAGHFKRGYSREWIDDSKLRRVLPPAILCEMDRYHLIGDTFEIERYANAIGGGRTKIGIKFHRRNPGLHGRNLAGAASVGDTGRELCRPFGEF
jgi:hypothetical protein